MPAMTATAGLIRASGRRLVRNRPGRRGADSRSGAVIANPIEPAPLLPKILAVLAAAVQERSDAAAGRRRGVGNRLLLGEYLDEHVRKDVGVLHAGPVL